ncbi:hypothetical protein GCM10010327_07000 [Streptomyces nitrosporeus]|nr:hypothetical protein GCM10010327_07000 [Streptomyces nitrosporeus]
MAGSRTVPAVPLSGLRRRPSPGPRPAGPAPPPRYPADAVRDARAGAYATARMWYGALVAASFAPLTTVAVTRLFRRAGVWAGPSARASKVAPWST